MLNFRTVWENYLKPDHAIVPLFVAIINSSFVVIKNTANIKTSLVWCYALSDINVMLIINGLAYLIRSPDTKMFSKFLTNPPCLLRVEEGSNNNW